MDNNNENEIPSISAGVLIRKMVNNCSMNITQTLNE